MENIYLTYYSLAGLVGFAMNFIVAVYLFTLRAVVPSTRWLALVCLSASMLSIAYALDAAFLDPLGAYHRWITVPFGVLLAGGAAGMFLPSAASARGMNRALVSVGFVAIVAVVVWYFWVSARAGSSSASTGPVGIFGAAGGCPWPCSS